MDVHIPPSSHSADTHFVPETQFNFDPNSDRAIAGNLDNFKIPETQNLDTYVT